MAEKYTGIAAGKSIRASDMEAALDSKVSLSGAETITGVKTFGTASAAADPVLGKAKTAAAANDGTKFATEAQVYAHTASTSNPHGVTAAQVGARPASWTPGKADIGLGNVDNISVNTAFNTLSFFPAGTILTFNTAAWNAASAAFKTVWKICDGRNGTPDLVNKFLRGGSASGSTGGTDSQSITLATANLPAHSHTITDPGHKHEFKYNPKNAGGGVWAYMGYEAQGTGGMYTESVKTGITINNTGSGTSFTVSTVPAYFTVIYIIKMV